MANRPHTSTLIEARADCQRCTWKVNAANAQALAAQHFDKKGHLVRVTTTTELVYGRRAGATAKGGKQESML